MVERITEESQWSLSKGCTDRFTPYWAYLVSWYFAEAKDFFTSIVFRCTCLPLSYLFFAFPCADEAPLCTFELFATEVLVTWSSSTKSIAYRFALAPI